MVEPIQIGDRDLSEFEGALRLFSSKGRLRREIGALLKRGVTSEKR